MRSLSPIAVALSLLVLGCASTSASRSKDPAPMQMYVNNQVQLLPGCSGASLTFFEGYSAKNLPYGQVTEVTVANLFNAYQIGFQVNGWYWRCGGAANCPNPTTGQNPDNAGQVGILLQPGPGGIGCASATLITSWTLGLCDNNVPSARNVLSVTLEDSTTCRVKITASGLDTIAPSASCCSCSTCTSPPGTQQTHCT